MRGRLVTIGAAILLCATGSPVRAQGTAKGPSRATLRNDIGIELAGKTRRFNIFYQRMVSTSIGLDAGLGFWEDRFGPIVFVPVGTRLYLIPKDASLFLTGGAILHLQLDIFGLRGYAGLGVEYRSVGGFVVRGTAYGLVGDNSYLDGQGRVHRRSIIWPGLSIGMAF